MSGFLSPPPEGGFGAGVRAGGKHSYQRFFRLTGDRTVRVSTSIRHGFIALGVLAVGMIGCDPSKAIDRLASEILPARSGMTVTAGLTEWQVFQRNGNGFATIACNGTSERDGDVWGRVLMRGKPLGGLGWHKVGEAETGRWSATIKFVPTGGPYSVDLRVGKEQVDACGVVVTNIVVGDIWILAGQSNMQGRGRMVNVEPPSPLVRTYGMNEKWEQAVEPLHWLNESIDAVHYTSASKKELAMARQSIRRKVGRGAGLGLPFAAALSSQTQVPIGLVPCAHGGTSIAQWDPAKRDEGGNSLYGSMYRRFKAVGGQVRGVLWYQGEAETRDGGKAASTYKASLTRFIERVREDFGDPELPFYQVQLGRTVNDRPVEAWCSVREDQRLVAREVPGVYTVAAVDLDLDDNIHIGTAGLKRLGRRLAKVADCALFDNNYVTPGPRVKSVTLADANWYDRVVKNAAVRVTFENINGRLLPDCHIVGFSLRDADNKEIAPFFDVMVDPEQPDSVLCLLGKPIPDNARLWYGYGLNPFCNLTDEEDMAVLAFGPMTIQRDD